MYPRIVLRARRENAVIKKHHPWIFSQAIEPPRDVPDGSLCDVYLSGGKTFFARGYYNSRSGIAVRLLSRDPDAPIDAAFLAARLRALKEWREAILDTERTDAYRLVFAESDGLPGLVLDRYAEALVLQLHTAGMERLRAEVVEAALEVFRPAALYERSDVAARRLEGLEEVPPRLLHGEAPTAEVVIRENGIPFLVDILRGQKTGFFLDQRENRAAVARHARGRRFLNCFAYTGAFTVYAALAGAAASTSVDASPGALDLARRNLEHNKVAGEAHALVEADAFAFLTDAVKERRAWDLVVLDPPAFTKERRTVDEALSGYLALNELALKLLPRHGILATSSCSAFVTEGMFAKMLALAANRARCGLKIIERRSQPGDHPVSVHFPEGAYLKFWICGKA
jgi:23S rRNA (cytosine1962-C5)-methyltransferase